MKLSWLGKLLLADYGIRTFGRMIRDDDHRGSSGGYGEEETDFSDIEIQAMMEAVERKDFKGFNQVYRGRRPRADADRVVESYEWFEERRKNGWK